MPYFAPVRQDDYPATADTQCVSVYIPTGDEYKALLAGFIAMLSDPFSYDDPYSAQAEGVAATFDEGYSQTDWNGCDNPPGCYEMNTSIMLLPDLASITSGVVPAWNSDTASSGGGYYQQNPPATADSMRWYFYLSPGRYAFYMFYLRNTVNGKGDFKVYDPSGTLLSTTALDLRGATQRNTVGTGTFDLPVGGRIHVDWVGTGSGVATFFRPVQRIWVEKYDDL